MARPTTPAGPAAEQSGGSTPGRPHRAAQRAGATRVRLPGAPPRRTTPADPPGPPDPDERSPAAGPLPADPEAVAAHPQPDPEADTAEPTPPRTPHPHSELGFNPNVLRVAVAVLAALVVLSAGFGWLGRAWLNGSIPQISGLERESPAIRNAAAQVGDENVLVLTTEFPTPGAPANPRAGTVVVAHVPAGADNVVALSLPGDAEINRPPCEAWDPTSRTYLDQTVPAEVRTTLLSAFEIGGPRCMTRVIQQTTGLAVTRFLAVDRAGLAKMAERVGVDACPAGPAPATEYARVQRDYQVLATTLDRALSFSALLAVPTVLNLGTTLPTAVLSDDVGIDRMLGIAQALDQLDADGVTFAPAPTAAAPNARGHTELRDGEASALFKALREDTGLPTLDPPRAAAVLAQRPADVSVDVFNASGRDGLAKSVAQQLGGFGFTIDEVANARSSADDSVITFSPDQAAAAELLAAALPGAPLAAEPGSIGVLKVTLGSGFDDVVQEPTQESGSTFAAAPSSCS